MRRNVASNAPKNELTFLACYQDALPLLVLEHAIGLEGLREIVMLLFSALRGLSESFRFNVLLVEDITTT
jgi:hypothetical protein